MKTFPFLRAKQSNREFFITTLPASLVGNLSYASVRGQDKEEGAIQRVLNTSRIASIRDFTLRGGDYPNAIVLNWVSNENPLSIVGGSIQFQDMPRSAQIIDGQHRVAGIRAAILEKPQIGGMDLPVVIYQNLSSKECADIFLSINEEQKPVPRSLVFDLFGIASEGSIDPAALRARDIAMNLHSVEKSPYFGLLKLPGTPIRKGGIAFSTAVSAIKPIVEAKGALEQIGVEELETQRQIILNLFFALAGKYKEQWGDKENAFLYASGFMAAVQFFQQKLVSYCSTKQSFKAEIIMAALNMPQDRLIWQSEIKGLGGSAAVSKVYERLVDAFEPDTGKQQIFEV
jgi:DNA sulfur modification protein DndB